MLFVSAPPSPTLAGRKVNDGVNSFQALFHHVLLPHLQRSVGYLPALDVSYGLAWVWHSLWHSLSSREMLGMRMNTISPLRTRS